ncbi:MAG: LamG domain-containing protein [Candidatus Poribacteria bacterium]
MKKSVWNYILVGSMAISCLIYILSADADLTDGLISAWTFDDGTAKDVVGKNNGKIHGGVKAVKGKFGQGLSFDGQKGSYVEVPDDKSLQQENALSVSAWIYVRQGKNHSAIAFKGEKIGWGDLYMFRVATTSNTGMTWGVCWPGTEGWFATDNVIAPNEWYHVTLTADGKQAIAHVAKDGKVNIPPSGQGNPHPMVPPLRTFPDKPLEIGVGRAVSGTVGNDAWYDGIIDEVYFWNRGLSEDEVQQLAKGSRPKLPVEPAGKLATAWGLIKIEK